MSEALSEAVRNFYTDVCEKLSLLCEVNNHQLQARHRHIISQLHEDVMKRYYGSGFLIPELIDGANILDLGCGSGSLVFVLSKLVGDKGHVIGIDFTPALILEAKNCVNYHREKWGYKETNVTFRVGNIENFDEIALPAKSQDVIVSNGVICLCPNQKAVLTNTYRLLKDGGEFCWSDVFADRDRPAEKLNDPKLYPLGTTGSMRWDAIGGLPVDVGFTKPYLVGAAPVAFNNEDIHAEVANAEFVCAEYRFFKLPSGARRAAAEVTYKGNIQGIEDAFQWDINTTFKKDEPVAVDSDLASILAFSRYKDSFSFKDTNQTVKTPNLQNPFAHLDDLRKQGHKLTPVYKV